MSLPGAVPAARLVAGGCTWAALRTPRQLAAAPPLHPTCCARCGLLLHPPIAWHRPAPPAPRPCSHALPTAFVGVPAKQQHRAGAPRRATAGLPASPLLRGSVLDMPRYQSVLSREASDDDEEWCSDDEACNNAGCSPYGAQRRQAAQQQRAAAAARRQQQAQPLPAALQHCSSMACAPAAAQQAQLGLQLMDLALSVRRCRALRLLGPPHAARQARPLALAARHAGPRLPCPVPRQPRPAPRGPLPAGGRQRLAAGGELGRRVRPAGRLRQHAAAGPRGLALLVPGR